MFRVPEALIFPSVPSSFWPRAGPARSSDASSKAVDPFSLNCIRVPLDDVESRSSASIETRRLRGYWTLVQRPGGRGRGVNGGRYWDRTSGPSRVRGVLYR